MPSVAAAVLAMALRHPSPTDAGVWLDPLPRVVTAPLRVTGSAQAPEGVLHVDLYVGAVAVASYTPALPVGEIPFAFTVSLRPGTYDVRVVATTLVRGLSADADGLVVPAPPRPAAAVRPPVVKHAVAPKPLPHKRSVAVAAPRIDDSGTAFGAVAPTLPYVRRAASPVTAATLAAPLASEEDRSGWESVAGGLVLLLVCSHLHRSLRREA